MAFVIGLAVIALAVVGVGVAVGSADVPPRPGTDESELDGNETATLWSKAPNTCISDAEYEDRYNESRTVMQELGNCTDLTFKAPPETAERWSAYDYESLEGGDAETSIYPTHANLSDSVLIADAHATTFAIHPSTRAHLDANETVHYIAPEGTLRGFVDYRVRLESNASVLGHEIEEVRLRRDGNVVDTVEGTQTPVFDYTFDHGGSTTLTLEADITARGERDDGNETELVTDQVTVSQDLDVEVYDLEASVYHASYPNGDSGVAIYQDQPWHGYTLSDDGEATVRGVWRYYTARDTGWDELTRATRVSQETVGSDSLPVYVHAYPSEIGPRTEPIRDGPEILEVWGTESSSPEPALHENADIDVISSAYTRSDGLALRYDNIDRDSVAVDGIVRGVTADIVEPDGGSKREIRESDLSVEIVDSNTTAVTLRLELRDAKTGRPIMLESPFDQPRFSVIGHASREGYITVGDQRVRTNREGVAEVTVHQPGIYTAEYHPGSWRSQSPAYLGATATEMWHPLATPTGWFVLVVDVVRYAFPFVVALYAAKRIGTFLKLNDTL
ncbi:hypothetical protein GCU68_07275 [Natronorubrum aibiense]|uniref:Uncharacterized protein n=2 Tax=Natronorubrum aibiense TaxID=348826 RepID=A0A5P9P7M5_9EURY|nr:hypothetical protein GCU68_07275 [Natronorubrum aibiense]